MKNLENNQFDINKTTMRELTPYELSEVAGAGAGGREDKSLVALTIVIVIGTGGIVYTIATN